MQTEWLKIMLEEIQRRQEETRRAREEEERRRQEQRQAPNALQSQAAR